MLTSLLLQPVLHYGQLSWDEYLLFILLILLLIGISSAGGKSRKERSELRERRRNGKPPLREGRRHRMCRNRRPDGPS